MRNVLLIGAYVVLAASVLLGDDPPAAPATIMPMTPENVTALADRVKKSVVVVTFLDRDGKTQGLGSGFVIREDGLIATNLHVLGEGRPISVRTLDGKEFPVDSIYSHEKSQDLAILSIKASGLPVLELGDSDQAVQGQPVVAVGNPLGLEHSVVTGVISGVRKDIEGMSMIQLAIPIEQGNSGGPLVDLQGRVLGLLTLKSLKSQNLGYAVTVNSLKPLIDKPNPIAMSRWMTIGVVNPRHWIVPGDVRWTQRAGRIRVSGQGAGFGGRSVCLSTKATPAIPFEVGVSVKMEEEDGAAGLVLFAQGDLHYGFYPSSGKLRFTRFDGPTVYEWHVLWEDEVPAFRSGEWNSLKVRVEADRMKCYCNEQLVHEEFDDDLRTGACGLAKFRHTSAEFRNFVIGDRVPSTLPSEKARTLASSEATGLSAARPPTPAQVESLLSQAEPVHEALEAEAKQLEQRALRVRQLSQEVHAARHRRQLVELLAVPDEQVDLAKAALLIAAMDNPEVQVEDSLQSIEDLAGDFLKTLPEGVSEAAKLDAFHRYLFDEQGFHGSRANYYSPSNSYLNETIDDREGLPITLSIVYMTIARRVGIKTEGVGLPGHFVVRVLSSGGGAQLIDPFDRGKILFNDEARKLVEESGREWDESDLQAQTARQILTRMLRNLLNLANERADAEAGLRYVNTILALDPESLADQVLKAVLCYNTQRFDEGIEIVDKVIQSGSPDIDVNRLQQLSDSMKRRREAQQP